MTTQAKQGAIILALIVWAGIPAADALARGEYVAAGFWAVLALVLADLVTEG